MPRRTIFPYGDACMIKLISLDVDGTLLDSRGRLSRTNLEAIQSASQRGIHVIINTGRPLAAMVNLLEAIRLVEPLITLTGGLILEKDPAGKWRVVKSYPIPEAIFPAILPAVLANQLTTFFLTENHGYVHHVKKDSVYLRWFECLMERNDFTGYESVANSPLEQNDGLELPVIKLMFCSDKRGELTTATRALEAQRLPGLLVESSSRETVEIHDRQAGKRQAIEFICQRLGIAQDEVMALGDHESDLSLIRWAGVGAMMANGQRKLKLKSPLIAPSNEEDGVAQMINAYAVQA